MGIEIGKEKKRVTVIGGGVAGSLISYTLQFHADVVLIDPKEYFEIPWANLRAMVDPSFAERSVINHSEYITNARVITSTAINIIDREVLTEDGQQISYDYLVITRIPFPKLELRLRQYQQESEKIESANSILIVGGGPTGVDLASEIAVDFPGKKVTLVHRGSRLLEFVGHKASKKALNWLIKMGVEVILDQSVDLRSAADGIYQTSRGETIAADCHFVCIGSQ
ncbi:FAD/NAD(P)-binding domain [Dillenia turbinata]|uniref:FAD/NAD(P)-binding domain n=1 Tax=Dillenia turbinata TaxID=194707 RepID=A0AAN8VJY9_9MAGN